MQRKLCGRIESCGARRPAWAHCQCAANRNGDGQFGHADRRPSLSSQTSYINEGLSTANVTLNNVPEGTFSLSASYSGDVNWNAVSYTLPQQLTFVANSAVATSTTTLTASTSSVNSSGSVTFNVTVTASTGQYGAPIGIVSLVGNGTVFAGSILGSGVVTASTTESATIVVPATELPIGQLNVTAVYSGAVGVASSVSTPVQLNVTASDFTFSTAASSLTVQSGQTGTVPLLLGGPYGIGVPVSLACAPSSEPFHLQREPRISHGDGFWHGHSDGRRQHSRRKRRSAPCARPQSQSLVRCRMQFCFRLWRGINSPCRRRKWRVQVMFPLFALLFLATSCGGGSAAALRHHRMQTPPPRVRIAFWLRPHRMASSTTPSWRY